MRTASGGADIFKHPHFLKHFRYFLFGPDPPETAIERFRKVVLAEAGTRGMILDALCRCACAEARQLGREEAAEEFFRLALECDLDQSVARAVREAVRRRPLRPATPSVVQSGRPKRAGIIT
jgi:hypothetical protein